MRFYLNGIGIYGSGIDSWEDAKEILTGKKHYEERSVAPAPATMLSSTERRRCGKTIRLALQVADEAMAMAGEKEAIQSVFTSSGGDAEILHTICHTLATNPGALSPTKFHNSVHNAPAGYWSIAHKTTAPSVSLSCYDGSLAGGFLEAAVSVQTEEAPILLVAYDLPAPEPLYASRPIVGVFGVAFILAPVQSAATVAAVDLVTRPESAIPPSGFIPALERLRAGNPAARALTLLAALASGRPSEISLEYLDNLKLTLTIRPTSPT